MQHLLVDVHVLRWNQIGCFTVTPPRTQLHFILVCKLFYKFLKRSKLSFVDQTELLNKEHEMFKGRVEVCFLSQADYMKEMLMVDVGVYSEQTLEDCLGDWEEVLWKWNACCQGKQKIIIFNAAKCNLKELTYSWTQVHCSILEFELVSMRFQKR